MVQQIPFKSLHHDVNGKKKTKKHRCKQGHVICASRLRGKYSKIINSVELGVAKEKRATWNVNSTKWV